MKEKYTVTGMSCAACSAGIERTVKKLNGVEAVQVSLMGESMQVEYDQTKITKEQILSAVTGLGYGVKDYDDNALKARAPQPDKLKKRFLYSLVFLLEAVGCGAQFSADGGPGLLLSQPAAR